VLCPVWCLQKLKGPNLRPEGHLSQYVIAIGKWKGLASKAYTGNWGCLVHLIKSPTMALIGILEANWQIPGTVLPLDTSTSCKVRTLLATRALKTVWNKKRSQEPEKKPECSFYNKENKVEKFPLIHSTDTSVDASDKAAELVKTTINWLTVKLKRK